MAGGARPGAGRKKGTLAKVTAKSREAAQAVGMLPHEWLLSVARGDPIEQKRWKIKYDKSGNEVSRELITEMIYPDAAMRTDCAKAAAPYYAPRLAVQTIGVQNNSDVVAKTLKELAEKLPV
jgi:hypothetical protein